MSIYDEITRIVQAKEAIKLAITSKGVEISDETKIDEYAAYINNIQAGGGDGEYEQPGFYDIITKGGTDYRGLFASHQHSVDLSIYDTSKVTHTDDMFAYYGNAGTKITNINKLDFSSLVRTAGMFRYSYVIDTLDFSGANFPVLEIANNMFMNMYNIESIDMSNVNIPNLLSATSMFAQSTSNKLTSINLTGANIVGVQGADKMFQNCNKITSLDLSGFDFSNATTISGLFDGCKLLVEVVGEIDLSNLYQGLSYSSSSNPFRNCSALETIYLKNIYKNSDIKNDGKWSIDLSPTIIKDECLIYIINELPDLINDKVLQATDKMILTLPKTNTLTAEQVQPAIDRGWTVANTTY